MSLALFFLYTHPKNRIILAGGKCYKSSYNTHLSSQTKQRRRHFKPRCCAQNVNNAVRSIGGTVHNYSRTFIEVETLKVYSMLPPRQAAQLL